MLLSIVAVCLLHMRADMFIGICISACTEMCIGVRLDMRVDMHKGTIVEMCIDVHVDMRARSIVENAYNR